MANTKTGFIFFRFDCDLWNDAKIRKLKFSNQFKGFGICIYIKVLSEIYRERGSYVEWDESTAFDIAEYFGVKVNLVTEIINYCCSVGLFNKELLTNTGVLTSKSIQRRYVVMWKAARRKRENINIPDAVCLLADEEIIEIYKEDGNSEENASPQKQNAENEKQNAEDYPQNVEDWCQNAEDCPQNSEFSRQEKKRRKKKKKELFTSSFTFSSPENAIEVWLEKNRGKNIAPLQPALAEWFEYKQARGEMYENARGVRACISKLYNIFEDHGFDIRIPAYSVRQAIERGDIGFWRPNAREIAKITGQTKSNFKKLKSNDYQQTNKNHERKF